MVSKTRGAKPVRVRKTRQRFQKSWDSCGDVSVVSVGVVAVPVAVAVAVGGGNAEEKEDIHKIFVP